MSVYRNLNKAVLQKVRLTCSRTIHFSRALILLSQSQLTFSYLLLKSPGFSTCPAPAPYFRGIDWQALSLWGFVFWWRNNDLFSSPLRVRRNLKAIWFNPLYDFWISFFTSWHFPLYFLTTPMMGSSRPPKASVSWARAHSPRYFNGNIHPCNFSPLKLCRTAKYNNPSSIWK